MGGSSAPSGMGLLAIIGIVAFFIIILAASSASAKKNATKMQTPAPSAIPPEPTAAQPPQTAAQPPSAPPRRVSAGLVTVQCSGCGAMATLKPGTSAVCEYCGATVSAKQA